MVAFTPDFITCNSSDVGNIPDVAGKFKFELEKIFTLYLAHINHIRNVAGIESVGIGSDFDGIEVYALFFFIIFSKYPF